MAASTYCNPAPDFLVSERCIDEPSGIIAAGFIPVAIYSAWTDFEDNTEWTTAINTLGVLVAYDSRGEFNGGEVNSTDDTFGDGADQEFLSYSFDCTYEHKGIHLGAGGARTNITAYNALAKLGGAYHFWFVDSGHKLWVSQAPVSVSPKTIVPKSKKEQEYWQVNVKWSDGDLPQTYDAPTITYIQP